MAQQGPLSGQSLANGKYLLGERLGGGGFGEVYKAEDTTLGNRPVAVKVLQPQRPISQADIRRFKEEALRLANLKHPNIPHIYEHFSEAGRWFLVMEFIEGETLKDYLEQRGGRLPVSDALKIGLQLAIVLDYLHTRQPYPIIFRDLKPANVMMAPDKTIYLIDFGIARVFTPGKVRDTFVALSRGYAAPEQHGTAQTTVRSDIYSLGATLHHLLSGQHPVYNQPLLWDFVPLDASIPPRMRALIMQMVKVRPEERPASMAEVKKVLQGMTATTAASSLSNTTPARTPPVDPALVAPTQLDQQRGKVTVNLSSGELPVPPKRPVAVSKPRTRWYDLPIGVKLAIITSWIIWGIVACLNYKSIGGILYLGADYEPPHDAFFGSGDFFNSVSWVGPGLISLSSIVLFFFWGWVIAHNGDQDNVYWAGGVGVVAITFAGAVCADLYLLQWWVPSPSAPDTPPIVAFLVTLIFPGILPLAASFILAISVGYVSAGLGGLIGKSLYNG